MSGTALSSARHRHWVRSSLSDAYLHPRRSSRGQAGRTGQPGSSKGAASRGKWRPDRSISPLVHRAVALRDRAAASRRQAAQGGACTRRRPLTLATPSAGPPRGCRARWRPCRREPPRARVAPGWGRTRWVCCGAVGSGGGGVSCCLHLAALEGRAWGLIATGTMPWAWQLGKGWAQGWPGAQHAASALRQALQVLARAWPRPAQQRWWAGRWAVQWGGRRCWLDPGRGCVRGRGEAAHLAMQMFWGAARSSHWLTTRWWQSNWGGRPAASMPRCRCRKESTCVWWQGVVWAEGRCFRQSVWGALIEAVRRGGG
jgi:hypothetical protein